MRHRNALAGSLTLFVDPWLSTVFDELVIVEIRMLEETSDDLTIQRGGFTGWSD